MCITLSAFDTMRVREQPNSSIFVPMKRKHIILIVLATIMLLAGILLNTIHVARPGTIPREAPGEGSDMQTVSIVTGSLKKYFADPAVVLTDTSGNTVPFSSLNGHFVFLRFRDNDCKDCYEAEIERLKAFSQAGKFNKNIVLLTSFANPKSIDTLKKNINIPFAIYQVDRSVLTAVPFEKIPRPYYFVQEADKEITKLFIPNKHQPSRSDRYLQSLGLNEE
jgi:hypothetical protein